MGYNPIVVHLPLVLSRHLVAHLVVYFNPLVVTLLLVLKHPVKIYINRFSLLYIFIPPQEYEHLFNRPRIYQLVATSWSHVDHKYHPKYFYMLNQSGTSIIDALGERFEGIFPTHGVTQQ